MIRAISLELYKRETESGLFPIHCYTGSKYVLNSGHSTKTLKEKRLKLDVCNIREMLEKKGISSVNWCTSKTQFADFLKKARASTSKLISVLNRECDIIKSMYTSGHTK